MKLKAGTEAEYATYKDINAKRLGVSVKPPILSSVEAEQELQTLGGIPIDRMTWRVVSKGEQYVPAKRIACLVFDAQPPMRGTRRARHEKRPENLKGRRWGRLEVVGYWGPRTDKQGNCLGGAENQRWVCRCTCGIFVIRNGKVIKNAKDKDDCCEYCRHLKYLKRAESYRRLGYNEDELERTA